MALQLQDNPPAVRGADARRVERALTRLRKNLGSECFHTEPEALRPYECDALSNHRCLPLAVAVPRTLDDVRMVLRTCHKAAIPVVPRGAGTGLSGGAMPRADAVVLSMTRFNRILEIDPQSRFARVEPGVRNLAISEAAAPHGLFFAPDPSSQFASSIGGNVAENSGGVHCVKYGLTVHNVLEVQMLGMDGEPFTVGGGGYDSPGLDLLALCIGSEGMLGVVTEVTVRLLPLPAHVAVMQVAFPTLESAGQAVADIIGQGVIPAGLEIMDQVAVDVVERYIKAGLPTDAAALLLCELDGTEAEVGGQLERVRQIVDACGGYGVKVAHDAAERERLWWGRKAAFPAMGQVTTDFYITDATVPRKDLAAVLKRIQELGQEYGLRVATAFHAGDGNLHPLILYSAADADESARTEQLGAAILAECLARGGTITGEHGIGAEKVDKACQQFGDAEIENYFAVKAAFDPSGLLNPGKAIPTLTRCAELRGSHVHTGQVPFPELERF